MKRDRIFFEKFKYASEIELKEAASLFSNTNNGLAEVIRQTLIKEHCNVSPNDQILLQYFFMASILGTLNFQYLSDSTRSERIATFKNVSAGLNIEYSFVTKLTAVVESIWDQDN